MLYALYAEEGDFMFGVPFSPFSLKRRRMQLLIGIHLFRGKTDGDTCYAYIVGANNCGLCFCQNKKTLNEKYLFFTEFMSI